VIVWTLASSNTEVFETCLGNPLEGRGRGVAAIRFAAIGPCSPYLLLQSTKEWLLFIMMWAPVPFAILNWRWAQQHKAFWDVIRAREKVRRAEKRSQKAAQGVAPKD
jgi:hypothetical protein